MFRKLFALNIIFIWLPFANVTFDWKSEQPGTSKMEVPAMAEPVDSVTTEAQTKNEEVLDYVVEQGRKLAPSYKKVVCTDYVINVLKNFCELTTQDKRAIQIPVSKKRLKPLVQANAPIIKGVQTALIDSGKGVPVKRADVQPGDFVQFWFVWRSGAYGHCGIVKSIGENTLTLYSSRPKSNGFSVHTYPFPHKAFFVRLK